MSKDKRILEILKTSLKRWIEETADNKVMLECQLYKEILDYIEYLEEEYKVVK